ncbi:MAG: trigger factor [Desulfomonile sp.]|jgi:trigger factor
MTNIQVEDLSTVKKKITFEVPEDKVLDVIDAEYRDLRKTVQIKGFRKGKVPLNILRSYFKGKVEADAARKIIEETFEPGLDEKNIKPVAVISIDPEGVETGKPFKYTAQIEVTPPLDIQGYKGVRLNKQIPQVTDDDVNKRIENLREINAKLVPITETRGVRQGDYLLVDIEATADGEKIPALSVKDYHVELGRNFYLPDFDSKLEGMKPEETRQIVMEFQEDFSRKNLSGKTGTFTVTCREAKERVLPELDDDFAKDLGSFENLDELRDRVTKELQDIATDEAQRGTKNQIIDQLIEKNPFEVPDSMVDSEIDRVLNQLIEEYVAQGIDRNRLPVPSPAQRDRIRPGATRAAKARLIMDAIVSQEGIEISDEELQAGIERRVQELGVSSDHLRDELVEHNMLEVFRDGLKDEKVYQLIEEHAEITEEETRKETENTQVSKPDE